MIILVGSVSWILKKKREHSEETIETGNEETVETANERGPKRIVVPF